MFDSPFWLLLIPVLTVPAGVFIGMKTYRFFNEPAHYADTMKHATPKNVPIPMFCRDCGKALVSYRSMDGYDTKTGQPAYSFQRACGDATRTGGPNTPGTWPYCGNRAKQRDIAGGHIHADPEQGSTACPACIDTMLSDGVLAYAQALGLYAKVTFTVESDEDDEDDRVRMEMYRRLYSPTVFGTSGPSKP